MKITNVPTTAGIVLGGLRFHPAAAWLLGWMVFGGVMFVWIRSRLKWVQKHPQFHKVPQAAEVRRIPAFGVTALVMISLAFLMVAAGMAWRNLQTLRNWQEAQATILDRRESGENLSRRQDSIRNSKGIPSRKTHDAHPRIRIEVPGGRT